MKNKTELVEETKTEETEKDEITPPKNPHTKRDIIIGILAVLVTLGLGVLTILNQNFITQYAKGYSLLGMLIISFLAGSLLSFTAVPVPYWTLVVALSTNTNGSLASQWGLLAPFAVGLVSAMGATIGHMPTFMIGYSGRHFSDNITSRLNARMNRWYQRIINWSHRHGWIAVFLTSAVFNPIHLPMTVAFGTLKYPPWKFFIFSFLGNCVKSLFLAFAGYYGLTSILKVFGL